MCVIESQYSKHSIVRASVPSTLQLGPGLHVHVRLPVLAVFLRLGQLLES